MLKRRRFSSVTLALTLISACLAVGACDDAYDIGPGDNVELHASLVGAGRIYAPNTRVPLNCYWVRRYAQAADECTVGFQDLGAGGTFEVIAEADDGWGFGSWGGDCSSFSDTTCTLSFFSAPARFDFSATFDSIPDAIVLSDDFNTGCADWSTTVSTSGVPGTALERCTARGGGSDGGSYREMTHELPDTGSIVVDHAYGGQTVLVGAGGGEPACIATVRFREQRVVSSPAFAGAAVGASVWIFQDGIRYRASLGQFTHAGPGWEAFDSAELTEADFTPAGLDLCPAVPTPLLFGYARSNTNTSPGTPQVNVHAIDEWSVTLQPGS